MEKFKILLMRELLLQIQVMESILVELLQILPMMEKLLLVMGILLYLFKETQLALQNLPTTEY